MSTRDVGETTNALLEKIKKLNELLWENRVPLPSVQQWLDNFKGERNGQAIEQAHALYILSKFLYFGQTEVRVLLHTMFQDLVRHHLAVQVRSRVHDKDDFQAVHRELVNELNKTRFLGIGNPSESGTHILYFFRQVNEIPEKFFPGLQDLVTGQLNHSNTRWARPEIQRLIFLDDFCGTGTQASAFGFQRLTLLRRVAKRSNVQIELWYLTLLATTTGLLNLRNNGVFDRIEAVSELDPTYRVFGPDSQTYANPPDGLKKDDAEGIVRHYGERLMPGHSLGYQDSQLLLGFTHNIPDNTLPIIWRESENPHWRPIFPRNDKF